MAHYQYAQVKYAALKTFTPQTTVKYIQLCDNGLNVCMCVLAEMLCGWWRVSDMEELQRLVKALHNRGIREKVLQKQIQKHVENMIQLCANSKDGWSTFHCSL